MDCGGVLHGTPPHVGASQAPLVQPLAQGASAKAYVQAPAEQTPTALKVRTELPTQLVAGGVVHETPAQGSATQPPLAHPKPQLTSTGVYPQVPEVQVPGEAQVRSVDELRQALAGGWLHVTPWHGLLAQAPFAQPKVQVVSACV